MSIITASHARRGKTGVPERLCGRTCGPLLVAAKGQSPDPQCRGWEAIFDELRQGNPVDLPNGLSSARSPTPLSPVVPQHPVAAASRLRTALSGKPIKPLDAFDAMAREREYAPVTIKRHRQMFAQWAETTLLHRWFRKTSMTAQTAGSGASPSEQSGKSGTKAIHGAMWSLLGCYRWNLIFACIIQSVAAMASVVPSIIVAALAKSRLSPETRLPTISGNGAGLPLRLHRSAPCWI